MVVKTDALCVNGKLWNNSLAAVPVPFCICNPGYGFDLIQYHDFNCALLNGSYLGYFIAGTIVHFVAMAVLLYWVTLYQGNARRIVLLSMPVVLTSYAIILGIYLQSGNFEASCVFLGIHLCTLSCLIFFTMKFTLTTYFDQANIENPMKKLSIICLTHVPIAITFSALMASYSKKWADVDIFHAFFYVLLISAGMWVIAFGVVLSGSLQKLAESNVPKMNSFRKKVLVNCFMAQIMYVLVPILHLIIGSLPYNGTCLMAFSLLNVVVLLVLLFIHLKENKQILEGTERKEIVAAP